MSEIPRHQQKVGAVHELKPTSRTLRLASLQWSSIPTPNSELWTPSHPVAVLVLCNREIQSENVLSRLTYYIPGRGDPKRMKVEISLLPVCLYMEDKHQRQNNDDGVDRSKWGFWWLGWPSDWSGVVQRSVHGVKQVRDEWGEVG